MWVAIAASILKPRTQWFWDDLSYHGREMSLMIGMVSVGVLFDRLHYVKYNEKIER
jgi:hypothetical protein